MTTSSFLTRIAVLALIVASLLLISANLYVHADDCCAPPRLQAAAARFQPNAQVTIYIDTTTGFTSDERQAITQGLEDWNDEPNNSGVRYNVVQTANPPAPGGNTIPSSADTLIRSRPAMAVPPSLCLTQELPPE